MDAFDDVIKDYGEIPEIPRADKEFTDIISRAQSLNEQVQENGLPFDHKELRREVQNLNRRWKAYIRRARPELAVTGTVYAGASYLDLGETIDDEFIECSQDYPISFIYRPIIGNGFAAIDTMQIDEHGTTTGEQRVLFVASVDLTQEDDTEEQIFLCALRPEDIAHPLPEEIYTTREMLSPVLQHHFDFTKHLVTTAYDETEATLALNQVVLIASENTEEVESYRTILNECLASSVRFSEYLPYIVEVQGEIAEQYNGQEMTEHVPVYVPERTTYLLAHLEVTADWDSDDTCKLMLKGTDLKGDMPHLRIPLDSLKNIESTKRYFKELL